MWTGRVAYKKCHEAGEILPVVSDDKDIAKERDFGLDTVLDGHRRNVLATASDEEFWDRIIRGILFEHRCYPVSHWLLSREGKALSLQTSPVVRVLGIATALLTNFIAGHMTSDQPDTSKTVH